ncbi:hypothetical protein E4U55_003573 [Claviceps digitariae]|nr:hypothetical protein E4U55_003573 [Claviceps digitariae]
MEGIVSSNRNSVDSTYDDDPARHNYADWLFDAQSSDDEFSITSIPFREGGLGSAFNRNINYDNESVASSHPERRSDHQFFGDFPDVCITESRREEFLTWFRLFRRKQPRYDLQMWGLLQESSGTLDEGILNLPDSDEDLPGLSLAMLQDCLDEFWCTAAPRLPVVHQPTFSPNSCPILLLLVVISLGAASLKSRDPRSKWSEYGAFADVIMFSVRWEIMTLEETLPRATLWVAQALLLVEYYEKLYTTRQLHERSHIYHASFLTLIRKGRPLIGRAEAASLPEPEDDDEPPGIAVDSRIWWVRWAEVQSMHRVLFVTFMMDVIHAATFGHNTSVGAHEIRLPLPCDDSLWTATSPEGVRQLDTNFKMYGVKEVSFLDGLKRTLHGKEVKADSFGKMILLCGVLSIGWHLNHRATDAKWLQLRDAESEMREKWRKLVLDALGSWHESFDMAMSDSMTDEAPGFRAVPNGPVSSAYVLFHFAHISLHADVIDLQVYAGASRLLGRPIFSADRCKAASRLETWAKQAPTRQAISHAFRLLYRVLVDPNARKRPNPLLQQEPPAKYSIQNESDLQRPWIMYHSTLAIWAFVHILRRCSAKGSSAQASPMTMTTTTTTTETQNTYDIMTRYLTRVAALQNVDDETVEYLHEGLPELLDVMTDILSEAYTEMMTEARNIMVDCRTKLLAGSG